MATAKQNQPLFSIVVPTLNEEKYFPLLLSDLTSQTFQDFEVIHVDGHSTDKTVANAKSAARSLNYHLVSTDVRNVSHQRNLGGKHCAGKWILFMDADVRINQFFLEDLRSQMAFLPAVATFTVWLLPDQDEPVSKTIINGVNFFYEFYKLIGRPGAVGAFIGVHRSILDTVQFSENQKVMEDSIFIEDSVKMGFPFIIFRYPRIIFSLRRLRSKGTLKVAKQVISMNLNYIQGKSFEKTDYGYEMAGGDRYDTQSEPFFQKIQNSFKNASKKQIAQAKRLLDSLADFR